MQYMMLIYVDENREAAMSEEEFGRLFAEYEKFDEAVREKGIVLSTAALQPTSTATTVQVRDGKTITMDGPYAEAKEHLGGYYMLECADLDEALQWAAKIPDAAHGTIEVRPKMVFG